MLDLPDDPLAFFDRIEALGLTDGLPVIPPLPAYVDQMLAAAGLPADEPVASVPPEGSVATVAKLAVSAVMAGCRPEYFAVVVAAMRALATPRYNLLAVQTTTNPVTPVLVVNGPVRTRIGLACGRGCLGNGFRANATIGRAIKLALLNLGGCTPGEVSKATHGFPGRYAFCFGELEEQSPWLPMSTDLGHDAGRDTVTVFAAQGTQSVYACFLQAESILHMLADGMRCYGNNGYRRSTGNPVVVLSPGHARIFHEQGWDKPRIREALWRMTHIPLAQMNTEPQLSPSAYDALEDGSGSVALCARPEDIAIVVAGGPEAYHLTYLPSFSSSDTVTVAI